MSINIVDGGGPPPQSMTVKVDVLAGRSQIQRLAGKHNAIYFAQNSNVQDVYVELDSLQVWASNPQETTQRLVVGCSGSLRFEGVRPDGSMVQLDVQRLLILDNEFRSFTLSNIGEEMVRATLNFVTTRI